MEIIFLVFAIFSGESFVTMEIRNYSEFSPAGEMSCDNYIGSAQFRKSLKLRGIKEPRIRAACMGGSQLKGFGDILNQTATWKEVALNEKREILVITGKIRHNPIENRRKSVDSYLGKDLVLVNSDGEFALYPSKEVSQKELIKLDGKKVKLRAIYEDHTPAADSEMQYPTDGAGAPLKRTGYRVIAIE